MKRWLIMALVAVIGIGAIILGQAYYGGLKQKESDDRLARAMESDSAKLSNLINAQIRAVEDLQAFELAIDPMPDFESFDRYSAGVMENNPNIDALGFIDTSRIVRHIYPLAGNEASIGLDLMTRPAAPFVESAIRERRTTLNDPTVNVMGDLAITARTPIYRGEEFLGMVEAIFDVSSLMGSFQELRDQRFNMQLYDARGRQFWGSGALEGRVDSMTIALEDNSWTMEYAWAADEPQTETFVLVLLWGFGGTLLLSVLYIINRVWTRSAWLNAAVAEKTDELNSAYLQLKDDMAQRETAERELIVKQDQLDLALRSAQMGIWHFDLVENRRYFDEQVCHLLGLDPEKYKGTAEELFNAVHPEDRESLKETIALTIEHDILYSPEYRVVWPDGSVHDITARGRLAFDDSGNPSRLNGVVWDITEQKAAETALAESEAKFREIFDKSRDAIGVSQQGTHVMVNPAYLRLFGYDDEAELVGTSILELIATDERDLIVDNVRKRASAEPMDEFYETRGLRRDGTEFDMEVSVASYELGGVAYTLVILRDTTEHKRLEASIRQSQKMESVGRLAGGVAHDFNNYMTAVEGYIDLTLMELPADSDMRENLKEARRSAERAADLTRQLLLFSRREPLVLKPLSLNATITNLLKMLRRLIGEQYSIVVVLDEKLPAIRADVGLMEQILMNLVVNARDAMPGGGEIMINTVVVNVGEDYVSSHEQSQTGEFVRLTVKDYGSGMDSEMVSYIFEPFFSTKAASLGTGLGLSVVYGIVTRHGGWIDVETSPGAGSSFSIYLPAIKQKAVDELHEAMPAESLRGAGENILLVEDEQMVREMAARMLDSNGYTVVAVADGESALEAFEDSKERFQLVFSDVILPGMDGIKLVGRLTKADPGMRVLLASGFSEGDQAQAIIDQGYRFLQKPYALTELLQQVKQALL